MSDRPREPDPALGGSAVDQAARQQTIIVETDALPPDEEDVVETLKRQLEQLEGSQAEKDKALADERRARSDAERGRQEAENRARQADQHARQASQDSQRNTAEAQLDSVKNALASQSTQLKSLAAAKSAALQEGNFDKASEIDADMAIMGGEIAQLRAGQAELERRIKEPPQESGRQPEQQSPSQQREAYIQRYTPKVQEWLRGPNGDRFFNDQAFQRRVIGAASYAENTKGIDNNSQAYIDFIEQETGLREAASPPPAQQQQQAPAAGRNAEDRRMTTAPAGGSTGGAVRSNADGSTTVYLSAGEKEMARRMDLTDAEYARHKRDLLNEGQIGPQARNR